MILRNLVVEDNISSIKISVVRIAMGWLKFGFSNTVSIIATKEYNERCLQCAGFEKLGASMSYWRSMIRLFVVYRLQHNLNYIHVFVIRMIWMIFGWISSLLLKTSFIIIFIITRMVVWPRKSSSGITGLEMETESSSKANLISTYTFLQAITVRPRSCLYFRDLLGSKLLNVCLVVWSNKQILIIFQ